MRPKLILLFVCGMLLLTYALFLETAKPVRIVESLIGLGAVATAGGIDVFSRRSQERRQPYTTTDWLKGRRPLPSPNPIGRWAWALMLVLAAARLVVFDRDERIGNFIQRLLILNYAAIGGIELFRKPRTEQSPPNSA
jgi:hypothetical protein